MDINIFCIVLGTISLTGLIWAMSKLTIFLICGENNKFNLDNSKDIEQWKKDAISALDENNPPKSGSGVLKLPTQADTLLALLEQSRKYAKLKYCLRCGFNPKRMFIPCEYNGKTYRSHYYGRKKNV